ncbi:MAG: HEAT repeat domain-containing protein, partial [Planctomycetota bacterium]
KERDLAHAYNFLRVRKPDGSACPRGPEPFARRESLLVQIVPNEYSEDEFVLNDHALLSEPGTYMVRAGVALQNARPGFEYEYIHSGPIAVVIEERSRDEMAEYIQELVERLCKTNDPNEIKWSIIPELAYTRDNRIVPFILDQIYEDEYDSSGAFEYYLPIENETKEMLLQAARERRMIHSIKWALRRFGCTHEEFSELAGVLLSSDDPNRLKEGISLIWYDANNKHVPRLVQLARHSDESVRQWATYAIGANRTEEALAALREFLEDPNQTVRSVAKDAILANYPNRGAEKDVLTTEIITITADPNDHLRWKAIGYLIDRMSDEDFEVVRALAQAPAVTPADKTTSQAIETVKTILQEPDRDVRDFVLTTIRMHDRNWYSNPWLPEDFPEIYAEYLKKAGQKSQE